ncbi:MAG TPA: hypothetical protein VII85_10455, partial [Candidatus Krumholzibacteriaceae bacterium]
MSNLYVSIIEAEADSRDVLAKLCEGCGWNVKAFASIADFTGAKHKREYQLLLVSMPDGAHASDVDPELAALRSWRQNHPQTQLVLLVPDTLST